LNSDTTNSSKFDLEMERKEREEKLRLAESTKELKLYTNILKSLETQAKNLSEPFEWPNEHSLVENWLGIAKVHQTTNETDSGPTMEEKVKLEENEAARKAKKLFLDQRAKIWASRMNEMREHAKEERLKNKEAKILHDRRIRIASEKLEIQHQLYMKMKKRLNDKKNEELNKKYLKIENITDSKDASDYLNELKEVAKLKQRDIQLHQQNEHFETDVQKLKQVEKGQINMTHVEKEELAEEVQDDMMQLDIAVSKR
jgi:hypothetical protein